MYKPLNLAECVSRYGKIQLGPDKRHYWPAEAQWLKPFIVPMEIRRYLQNTVTGKPVERIFCNRDIHRPLAEAFENILTAKLEPEFKTFDGCYNVRYSRGSDIFSLHSYAIALDFNAKDNPLNGKSSWSQGFVRCFTDVGWRWGGDFKTRPDPMHFDWCGPTRQEVRLVS